MTLKDGSYKYQAHARIKKKVITKAFLRFFNA